MKVQIEKENRIPNRIWKVNEREEKQFQRPRIKIAVKKKIFISILNDCFRKVSPLHRAHFIVISCALYEARRTKLQKPKALLLLLLTEFSDVVVPLVPCHHHSSRQSNTKPVQIWRQWTIRQKSNVFPAEGEACRRRRRNGRRRRRGERSRSDGS